MLEYLLAGVAFTWFVDVTSCKNGDPLTPGLRIACVLVWPLAVLSFVWGYIKGRND